MRKYQWFVLALCAFMSTQAYANVIIGQAAIPDNYYEAVDGKKNADNILNALNGIIKGHNVINYNALEDYYEQTDFYADTLWDMYSTCRFTMADANHPQSAVCDGWNKEHLVCQSWLGSGPMVSDLFNVYPTDARINNLRSNDPYGIVSDGFSGFSKDPDHHGLGKLGSSAASGIGKCYEPDDRYKGDFARSFFYMAARYRENILNNGNGAKMYTSTPTNLTAYSLSFLLEWHRNDPVSQKEIDRNQAVYGIQHNRNPFIDYPDLVEYIWGSLVGQPVDLASMTPTCAGGGSVEQKKYGVSWSVCGTVIGVDSVIEYRAITALPETPVSCSETSDVFMGWTDQPIDGTTDEAPAVLYTKLAAFPAVTKDVTYYAVFAHGETGSEVEPAVYVYDETHQDEQWTNTASWFNNSYWLLDKDKVLISPEVELAGLSSIVVNIRTYGGTNFCNLDVTANGQPIATIVAINGKTLTEYTWTNESQLSGRAPLTFSTNYGTNQGIGFTSVIINATGAGTTYSAYLTEGEKTAIDHSATRVEYRKVLLNGQLFIMVNEQLFTLTGQRVR